MATPYSFKNIWKGLWKAGKKINPIAGYLWDRPETPEYEAPVIDESGYPTYEAGSEVELDEFSQKLQDVLMAGLTEDLGLDEATIRAQITEETRVAIKRLEREVAPYYTRLGRAGGGGMAGAMTEGAADIYGQAAMKLPAYLMKAKALTADIKGARESRAMDWSQMVEGRRRSGTESELPLWQAKWGLAQEKAEKKYETDVWKAGQPTFWDKLWGMGGAVAPYVMGGKTTTVPKTTTADKYFIPGKGFKKYKSKIDLY